MSSSIAGLKQLAFCDKGTLATAPTNPIAVGLREGASHKFAPYRSVKDYRAGEFITMWQHSIEATTIQPTMQLLKLFTLSWLNLNCDVQAITNIQTPGSATSDDVLKFIGDSLLLGLGFDHKVTDEKRSTAITLKRAISAADHKALIDGMDSASAVAIDGITGRGENPALFRPFNFMAFEAPKTTAIVPYSDIDSLSLSIKTKGKDVKLQGYDKVDKLIVLIEATLLDASAAKVVELLNKDVCPSMYLKCLNAGTNYDAYDFNSGVLTLKHEYENSDEQRILKLTATREIDLWEVDIDTGATAGGDAVDATKGGTFKVGY